MSPLPMARGALALLFLLTGLALFLLLRTTRHNVAATSESPPVVASLAAVPNPTPPLAAEALTVIGRSPLEAALEQTIRWDFRDCPLSELVAKLAEQSGVPLAINVHKLDEVGLTDQEPVSLVAPRLSLRTGLELLLGDLQLTWCCRDETVQITTPEDAESRLDTRLHPVADLIRGASPKAARKRLDDLRALLTSHVAVQSWDEVGGPGEMVAFRGHTFVVSQMLSVQREVADALGVLRRALQAQAAMPTAVETVARLNEVQKQATPTLVPNYTFKTLEGSATLLDLFAGKAKLFAIHNMGQACRYCTIWADGFNAFLPHLESEFAVVLLSKDSPEMQRTLANARGWRFRMASHGGGDYIREQSVMAGQDNMPGLVTYQRQGDQVYKLNSAVFGPGDLYCSIWHILSLAGVGEEDWTPQYGYWKRPQKMDDGGLKIIE